ncbi:MAG: nuclear transport factor 2 family protein [Rhodospirillales bacterium]|jgi:steroid delta-isomerase
MTPEEALGSYIECLTNLKADNLEKLSIHLSDNVVFKDPFHNVQGIEKMERIFHRLFDAVNSIEYQVLDQAINKDGGYFSWILNGNLAGKLWHIHGVTHVTFDNHLKVSKHIEYWDAASQIYERLPVIGWLLGFFRRRITGA